MKNEPKIKHCTTKYSLLYNGNNECKHSHTFLLEIGHIERFRFGFHSKRSKHSLMKVRHACVDRFRNILSKSPDVSHRQILVRIVMTIVEKVSDRKDLVTRE